MPASDTGAFEMAMWSMLDLRPVDMLVWESFGQGWATDATKQLKIEDCRVLSADYGALPDLGAVRRDADVCFTWNGTTSGARVPNGDWIADDRAGLTFCDATSAAFAQDLPWAKLDVTTFSWQKAMGGEGGHGILVLSPRAVERLESYTPLRPLPKIFRLTKGGKLIEGIFAGETINTPSMFCVADAVDALDWMEGIGGLAATRARADANFAALQAWVDATPWVENLVAEAGGAVEHLGVPQDRRPGDRRARRGGAARLRQADDQAPRDRGCGLRYRRLSRRASGPPDLVRHDGRGGRRRGADAVARLGLRSRPRLLIPFPFP